MTLRNLLIGLAAVAALLVGLWAALPWLPLSAEALRHSIDPDRGKGAMVFVESPEVYTRQRLVNDRYEQDAWLRAKLREINDPESLFISEQRERSLRGAVGLGTSAAAEGAEAAAAADTSTDVPFRERFDLQAAARDMIRQRILENALDDRHDLSGNTVFGLKFDTAVLPGSNTRLNPTVVIKMDADPLKQVPSAAELADHYKRRYDPDEDRLLRATPEAPTLALIDDTFTDWRQGVEQRLNRRMDQSAGICPAPVSSTRAQTQVPLCNGPALSQQARTALMRQFRSLGQIDDALSDVLRLSAGQSDVAETFREIMLDNADASCFWAAADGQADQLTVSAFLDAEQAIIQRFAVPYPWGQFFDLSTSILANDNRSCPVGVAPLQLEEIDLPVIVAFGAVDDDIAALLADNAWRSIACGIDACLEGAVPRVSIFVQTQDAAGFDAPSDFLEDILDDSTLATLIGSFAGTGSDQCFVRDGAENPFFFISDAGYPPELESRCFIGHSLQFRQGAFVFLQRMKEVESYTYAAFPRGDVSGVVSESSDDLAARAAAPGGSAEGVFGFARRNRRVEAEPTVINFASGVDSARTSADGEKLFDFGWSIVKPGVKRPMLASQLVLVSVPVYLDTITLTTWTGLLDPDLIPLDRGEHNDLALEARIAAIMPSFERRELTINLPRLDIQLLDSLVVGGRSVVGPRLDYDFRESCHLTADAGPVSIVIPGDRLWRSTVVTLDGLRADRIEVMPDMRGILATFNLEGGSGAMPAALAPGWHTLSVWTSEANASARIFLKDRTTDCEPDEAGQVAASPAETGSATDQSALEGADTPDASAAIPPAQGGPDATDAGAAGQR